MIFLPHTNTVILLEPYCGTITEPGLPVGDCDFVLQARGFCTDYLLLGCLWRPIMEWVFSVEKRQNGGRYTQKALRVSIPLQQSPFLRGGNQSFQVVWAIDLEIDLE